MAKPIHSMIRVLDGDKSIAFYQDAFSMTIKDRYDFDGFSLVYLVGHDSSFELELTLNNDRKEPYDLGDGYGHIAFCVKDLDGMHEKLKSGGYEPRDIVEFNRDGALFARFFFVADPDGYQIEVLQEMGRFG